MFIDKQNLMSEDQAVTVSAASTNVIDLGDDDAKIQTLVEKGNVDVFCQVTETFADGTSMKASLQTSDAENFSPAVTLLESAAIGVSSLVAGYKFPFSKLPAGTKRYLRMYYTVVGTMSDGSVTAALAFDSQTNGM